MRASPRASRCVSCFTGRFLGQNRRVEQNYSPRRGGLLMRSQDGLARETNSLSLRERARVRGKAACNCQGLGALPGAEPCFASLRVVELIGSSQTRWFAGRFFPLTPALSPRRGRTVRCAVANPERLDSSPRGIRCSLRGESGRAGRNTRSFSGNVFRAFPSPRPSPRSFLAGRGRSRSAACSPWSNRGNFRNLYASESANSFLATRLFSLLG